MIPLVLLALAPAPGGAEVTVRVSGGRVDLTATAAPLGDVLDRLARQTGMKVVYEGPAPRQSVTLSIQGRTPAEAVLSLLEGSGVNFALVGDATGTGVQTLVVAGAASASSAPATAPTASRPPTGSRRPFGIPPASDASAEDALFAEDEAEVPEELDPGVPPGASDPAATGAPGALVAPQGPARQPGSPAVGSPPPALPFSASPFTPQPQPFPPGVSAPTPARPSPEENPASAVPPPS